MLDHGLDVVLFGYVDDYGFDLLRIGDDLFDFLEGSV